MPFEYIEINGTYTIPEPFKGQDVAFYLKEDFVDEWFPAKVTMIVHGFRVHLIVFEPNGISIRKKVDVATTDRICYRWLPLDIALEIQRNA